MADRSTMHTLRADMVMLGDDVARLEQSAIDEGSMFEMGYFSALWEVMEQLQIWDDMSGGTEGEGSDLEYNIAEVLAMDRAVGINSIRASLLVQEDTFITNGSTETDVGNVFIPTEDDAVDHGVDAVAEVQEVVGQVEALGVFYA